MKKLLILLILLTTVTISAKGSLSFSEIFNKNYKSIALIEEGVMLKSGSLKNKELFRRLEGLLSKKIIDNYYCFAKGSAFVVSSEGHMLTNYHVLSYINADDKRDMLYWKFIYDMVNNLPSGYFTKAELRTMIFEFENQLRNAEFTVVVRFYDESYSVPKVLLSDSETDMCLLQTSLPSGIPVLKLSTSGNLNSGQEVAAIGYPLQNLLENFLKDFKPTFTTGVISAIRNEGWGIQHTASINPGNSGGPLMSLDGKVVGINVGTVTDAQNMYFAIPIDKCTKLLSEKGFSFNK